MHTNARHLHSEPLNLLQQLCLLIYYFTNRYVEVHRVCIHVVLTFRSLDSVKHYFIVVNIFSLHVYTKLIYLRCCSAAKPPTVI